MPFETEEDLVSNGIISRGIERDIFIPGSLLLQWHITDRCNLKCIHCYQDKDDPAVDLPLEQLKMIFGQYLDLLKKWRIKGHINFTGGEPFIREDFGSLLEHVSGYKKYCSYAVLSNGTIMTKDDAGLLKKTGCRYVQVSVEGGEKLHDEIRGKGSFAAAIRTLKLLGKKNIFTYISFTAHKGNAGEFGEVVKAAKHTSADVLWTDRLIPIGAGKNISSLMMGPGDVKDFFERSFRLRRKLRWNIFTGSVISMHRALQFITLREHGIKSKPYRCKAGISLVTVLPDGSLLPCRRMPIVVGNIIDQNIEELYRNSSLFLRLRSDEFVPGECSDCGYCRECGGGLKCLSYAYYGTPFRADPQCFLLNKNQTDKEYRLYGNFNRRNKFITPA